MENQAILIEQSFPVSAEKLWKALTEKEEMKLWYFELQEFKPEPGFEFQFMGGPAEARQYKHLCKITEVIPLKKLAYTWAYEGYDGISTLTFEIFPEDGHCSLKLSHENLESFPANNPDFDRKNFVEGWNWIIGKSLKEYFEKP